MAPLLFTSPRGRPRRARRRPARAPALTHISRARAPLRVQVLDEMRPYLMADGGNVAVAEIDGPNVFLQLEGACGSCPSSAMTMKMGLERGLKEKIPEIATITQVPSEVRPRARARAPSAHLAAPPARLMPPPRPPHRARAAQGGDTLSAEAVEVVLEEVRPFLQMAGGEISLKSLSTTGIAPTATLVMVGEGAALTSVKVEIQQRLKRKLPALVNVMWE